MAGANGPRCSSNRAALTAALMFAAFGSALARSMAPERGPAISFCRGANCGSGYVNGVAGNFVHTM